MAGSASGSTRHAKVTPYLLSLPALAYLAVFFVVPLWALLRTSLSANTGSVFDPTLTFSWEFSNYTEAFSEYNEQILRSFEYALTATILALLLAYPLAYVIAFKAGKWKNLLLGLVIVPFFITFIVRTLAWKTIFGDDTLIVSIMDAIGLTDDGRILSTKYAVIGGLTYNFLPFMILPIYVSLEKVDLRLAEAAKDLYANGFSAFRRVILPLSLPGVFAGSLLTFIPAAGDFINAKFLGGPNNSMIGTVVQDRFLVQLDYPTAAALSFVLMVIITVAVLIYARLLGTDDLV